MSDYEVKTSKGLVIIKIFSKTITIDNSTVKVFQANARKNAIKFSTMADTEVKAYDDMVNLLYLNL